MVASLEWWSCAKGLWATLRNTSAFSFSSLCPTSWEFYFHLNRGSQHSKKFSLEWVILRDYIGSLNPKRTVYWKGQDLKGVKWGTEYKKLYVDFILKENECAYLTWTSLLWKSCCVPWYCSNLPSVQKLTVRYSSLLSLLLSYRTMIWYFIYITCHIAYLFSLKPWWVVPCAPTK